MCVCVCVCVCVCGGEEHVELGEAVIRQTKPKQSGGLSCKSLITLKTSHKELEQELEQEQEQEQQREQRTKLPKHLMRKMLRCVRSRKERSPGSAQSENAVSRNDTSLSLPPSSSHSSDHGLCDSRNFSLIISTMHMT